ncbi:hypothetical protein BLNAU_11777 [Blattamonas nauphoetae]|uniref:Uncharacterized protein n=1 Tax=Blattamonas nauphoetae TaxID=2049346 RepID=A0ABQ9XNI8_9EUKA|nr:hypothetical protein BLNAU_11777 [Blattamonas nauphoetae]
MGFNGNNYNKAPSNSSPTTYYTHQTKRHPVSGNSSQQEYYARISRILAPTILLNLSDSLVVDHKVKRSMQTVEPGIRDYPTDLTRKDVLSCLSNSSAQIASDHPLGHLEVLCDRLNAPHIFYVGDVRTSVFSHLSSGLDMVHY